MQGDASTNRKPKHRADGFELANVIPYAAAIHAYAHDLAKLNSDPDADCNCDPLTDGYANPDCDTHGIPVQPRTRPVGRRSRLLGEVPEG
jgi:hypothetical protein